MTNHEIELTTDQQGRFTGQISGLGVGTHTITIGYGGDANYTSSTATRTVNVVNHDYNIDITSTTPIIQTGDRATIVTTLTDNGVAVTGQTLTYKIKHENTVIDSGSDITDLDGQIRIDYTGTGIGEIEIIASYNNILQKTYRIIDGTWIDLGTSTNYKTWQSSSNINISRSTETTLAQEDTSSFGYIWQSFNPTPDIIIEFDMYISDNSTLICSFRNGSTTVSAINGRTAGLKNNTWGHVKLKLTNGKVFVNDSSSGISISTWNRLYMTVYNGVTYKYKNFFVYPFNRSILLTLSCSTPTIGSDDTAVVVASLTKDSFALAGETLTYQIKHDNTVIDSGSAVTDSNGEISISYTGTGIGDVDVIVSFGMSLQETFVIEDCWGFDSMTSNSGKWTFPSGLTLGINEYSENGWKYGNANIYTGIVYNQALPNLPFEISFLITESIKYNPHFAFNNDSSVYVYLDSVNKWSFWGTQTAYTYKLNTEYKIKIYSNKVELYEGNTLLSSKNTTLSSSYLALYTGANRWARLKNLKIKAL